MLKIISDFNFLRLFLTFVPIVHTKFLTMKTIRKITILALLALVVISTTSCWRRVQQQGWHGAGAAKPKHRR